LAEVEVFMQTQEYVIERLGRTRIGAALRELWSYRAITIAFAERNGLAPSAASAERG
jgi:hypothetical protein